MTENGTREALNWAPVASPAWIYFVEDKSDVSRKRGIILRDMHQVATRMTTPTIIGKASPIHAAASASGFGVMICRTTVVASQIAYKTIAKSRIVIRR
jgi:hypothetical protein